MVCNHCQFTSGEKDLEQDKKEKIKQMNKAVKTHWNAISNTPNRRFKGTMHAIDDVLLLN
ncbi:MAG: hypothetical protein AAGA02_14630 [Bacteroidota bacterium]